MSIAKTVVAVVLGVLIVLMVVLIAVMMSMAAQSLLQPRGPGAPPKILRNVPSEVQVERMRCAPTGQCEYVDQPGHCPKPQGPTAEYIMITAYPLVEAWICTDGGTAGCNTVVQSDVTWP